METCSNQVLIIREKRSLRNHNQYSNRVKVKETFDKSSTFIFFFLFNFFLFKKSTVI